MAKGIRDVKCLKAGIPAVKDTMHEHRELLGTQQRIRRIGRALKRDRPGRARLEQRSQKWVRQHRRCRIQIRHTQDLDLDALTLGIVAAQIVSRAGDNALTGLGGSGALVIGGVGAYTPRARGPRDKQQLHAAPHARTKN